MITATFADKMATSTEKLREELVAALDDDLGVPPQPIAPALPSTSPTVRASSGEFLDVGLDAPAPKSRFGLPFRRTTVTSIDHGARSTEPPVAPNAVTAIVASGSGEDEDAAVGEKKSKVPRASVSVGAAKGAATGAAKGAAKGAVNAARGLRAEAALQVKAAKAAAKAAAAAAKNPEAAGGGEQPAHVNMPSDQSVTASVPEAVPEDDEDAGDGGGGGDDDDALERTSSVLGEMHRFSRAMSNFGSAVSATRRSVSRFRGSSVLALRPQTASEGIALLKKGSVATKFSKHGRARPTKFTLSEDESSLRWAGRVPGQVVSLQTLRAGVKTIVGQPRHVLIADVLDLSIGMQSDVFKRHLHLSAPALRSGGQSDGAGDTAPHPTSSTRNYTDGAGASGAAVPLSPNLFLSLVLMGALPPRPDEVDDMAGDDLESGSLTERATLDLSFDDDEIFGLWVAALRELLAEGQQRPAQYPTPYAPLHASAGIALRRAAPRGASTYEKVCPSSRPLLTTPWLTRGIPLYVPRGRCATSPSLASTSTQTPKHSSPSPSRGLSRWWSSVYSTSSYLSGGTVSQPSRLPPLPMPH